MSRAGIWHLMYMGHALNWRPGEYGKGLIHGGAVHTWGVGPNQDGSPTHPEYVEKAFGMNEGQYGGHMMFDTAFGINPDGALNVFDDNGWSSHPENKGKVAAEAMAVDPRLYVPGDDKPATWNFLGVAKNDEKWQLVKMGMPIGEDYWGAWSKEPQNALYHGTASDRLESIMQHGLHPWDSPIAGGTNYAKPKQFDEDEADDSVASPSGWLMPRPNHTYMTADPLEAHLKARDAHPQDTTPITLRIDPKYLDTNLINPDEDEMSKYDPALPHRGQPDVRPEGANSLGEYAEQQGFGKEPWITQKAFNEGESIGYKGVIPPEAITPGRMLRDENDARRWQPIQWPYTSSLKRATITPWESGQWGKGIYYPETGTLQTWADERTHTDVWNDDENYAQPGSAHHLVLRPNGTVHDQGAFERDFGDAESDVEGLQRALKGLSPSLRLDPPDTWSFGPTEPMEEEPSSVSRGEDGGSVHGVQTGNDFAGSL